MTSPILRYLLAFSFFIALPLTTSAQEAEQGSHAQSIVGSTDRTAGQGYGHKDTLWHLANIDHQRWHMLALLRHQHFGP
jgi:hypothetical protein